MKEFSVQQASAWVEAVLPSRDSDRVAGILESQQVDGASLLMLTYGTLVAEPLKIPVGPAVKLARLIAAVAPSGLQAGRRKKILQTLILMTT